MVRYLYFVLFIGLKNSVAQDLIFDEYRSTWAKAKVAVAAYKSIQSQLVSPLDLSLTPLCETTFRDLVVAKRGTEYVAAVFISTFDKTLSLDSFRAIDLKAAKDLMLYFFKKKRWVLDVEIKYLNREGSVASDKGLQILEIFFKDMLQVKPLYYSGKYQYLTMSRDSLIEKII